MSRGPGWIERRILSVCEEADSTGFSALRLAVYGTDDITPSQRIAFSRAIWGLNRKRKLWAWSPGGGADWQFEIPRKGDVYGSWNAMLTDEGWVEYDLLERPPAMPLSVENAEADEQ